MKKLVFVIIFLIISVLGVNIINQNSLSSGEAKQTTVDKSITVEKDGSVVMNIYNFKKYILFSEEVSDGKNAILLTLTFYLSIWFLLRILYFFLIEINE
jgi:hypothetical protein